MVKITIATFYSSCSIVLLLQKKSFAASQLLIIVKRRKKKLHSPAGNRTRVFRVTGGDTYHYTTEDYTHIGYENSIYNHMHFHIR